MEPPQSAPEAGSGDPPGSTGKRKLGRPPLHKGCQICGCSLEQARVFHQVWRSVWHTSRQSADWSSFAAGSRCQSMLVSQI